MPRTDIGHLTISKVPRELREHMRAIAESNLSSVSAEAWRAMSAYVELNRGAMISVPVNASVYHDFYELAEDERLIGPALPGVQSLIGRVLREHVDANRARLKKIAKDKLEAELEEIEASDARHEEAQRVGRAMSGLSPLPKDDDDG